MSNPYLERLRSRSEENRHLWEPSKPSKQGYEGFEGDRGCHVFRSEQHPPAKNASPSHSQNRQNLYRVLTVLETRCPDHVPIGRWQHAVVDGRAFLARWGEQASELGWSARDLFGLAPVPDGPHPSYRRMSRYDCIGLIWLLEGKEVIALTAESASIRNPITGNITVYRRFNKPAYGPLGDSLDDFE
jgi:hypothetical protein